MTRPREKSAPRGKALAIDDDPAVRRKIQAILEADGWHVTLASDAREAREVAAGSYDVVLIDFLLPDADGVQLVRELRERGMEGPVIAVTGAESETVVEALLRAGAHDVLDKARLDAVTLRAALAGAVGPPPIAPSPRPRPPDDEEPSEPLHVYPAGGRALVVDDVASARLVARRMLEADGWKVDEAPSAADGLRRALSASYDVILLDHLLPDVDGAGLLHELRRRGVETPVIALTGHGDEQVAREFAERAVADYVTKERLTSDRLREALARAMDEGSRVRVRRSTK